MRSDAAGAGAEPSCKQGDRDDSCNNTGVVGLIDTLSIIRLLSGVPPIGTFV